MANFPHPEHARRLHGTVEPPDAETAIKLAIEQFGITDPEKQKRLVARRIS